MIHTKTFFIIFIVCNFLFAADSTTTQTKPMFKMTAGAIAALDTVNNVIIVTEGNGQDTMTLTAKTVFSRYSTPINKTELTAGDKVTVHYRELAGKKTATRVVIRDR